MEEDFEGLKVKYQQETLKSADLSNEVTELQVRGREALDEISQLTRAVEAANKKRADVQSVVDEVVPKYEALRTEHISTKEELEARIAKLEDQLNSALHREEVFKDKWRRADEDCEKYKAEADARGLKVEYLENKLEEKYHVENLFSQLKEDYEDLRREKQASYESLESRLIQKEEEIRKAAIERDEVPPKLNTRFSERISNLKERSKRRSLK
jgi:chromosome segregation ATPase